MEDDDSPWATPPQAAPPAPAPPPKLAHKPSAEGDGADVWGASDALAPADGTRSSLHADPGLGDATAGQSAAQAGAGDGVGEVRKLGFGDGDDDDAWAADEPASKAGPSSPRVSPATSAPPAEQENEDDAVNENGLAGSSPPPAVNGADFATEDDDDEFAFASPAAAPLAGGPADAADNFDDFGDFDDAQDGAAGFGDVDLEPPDEGPQASGGFVEEPSSMPIKPLQLEPLPSRADLLAQLEALVSTFIFPDNADQTLTTEPIRQVEGLSQLLQTESARERYAQLTTPPVFKPLDWTRSRARREHLIALGIPVNLDEVESHGLKPLPPLKITTTNATPRSATHPHRSQSLDTRANGGPHSAGAHGNADAGPSRSRQSTSHDRGPANGRARRDESSLGEKPPWNKGKSERLLEYREDQLSLVPPKYLQRMQEDLVEACSAASSQLAWLRQLDEVRRDENKRKNDAIGELISKAQRLKASEAASSSSGGLFRKGSQKRGASGSGYATPMRTGSPAMR